jgi:hypothetical protein
MFSPNCPALSDEDSYLPTGGSHDDIRNPITRPRTMLAADGVPTDSARKNNLGAI